MYFVLKVVAVLKVQPVEIPVNPIEKHTGASIM